MPKEKQIQENEAIATCVDRVVAVTGTSEFLGIQLIARLDDDPQYKKVLALDVREPTYLGRKTIFCQIDLASPESGQELAELFRTHRVQELVHLAFISHPIHDTIYAHELQVIGTMHVLHAASAARLKKVIMLGTTQSYGARPDNPNFLREDAPLRGVAQCPLIEDLIETEKQFEEFAKKHPQVVTTVLRMGCMLGPNAEGFIPRLLSCSTVPTVMGYDPLFQFLHQNDALNGLKLALDQDKRGPFNIVPDGVLPLSTVLRLGGRIGLPIPHFLWAKAGRLLWTFQALEFPPSLLDYLRYLWVADGSRARQELHFSPAYTTRETILDFFNLRRARSAPSSIEYHS